MDLYVVSALGGKANRLTFHPADDVVPSIAGDGRYIYFCSWRSGRPEIWRINTDGTSPAQITTHGGTRAFASNDGSYLYYARGDDGRSRTVGIWRKSLRESVPDTQIVADSQRWTLRGNRLWYTKPADDGAQLRYLDLETRSDVLIGGIPPGVIADLGIHVSPDGRYMLYTQDDNPGSDVMLVERFR